MKARSLIASAGAVAVVGGGSFLLPAAASTHSVIHKVSFTATTLKSANFSKNTGGRTEIDYNKAGKIIGFDVASFAFNPKTNSASGRVAVNMRGGFIYGRLKFTQGPVIHGSVTGGTGKFNGVTGTITARSLNRKGTRTAVTITYHS